MMNQLPPAELIESVQAVFVHMYCEENHIGVDEIKPVYVAWNVLNNEQRNFILGFIEYVANRKQSSNLTEHLFNSSEDMQNKVASAMKAISRIHKALAMAEKGIKELESVA